MFLFYSADRLSTILFLWKMLVTLCDNCLSTLLEKLSSGCKYNNLNLGLKIFYYLTYLFLSLSRPVAADSFPVALKKDLARAHCIVCFCFCFLFCLFVCLFVLFCFSTFFASFSACPAIFMTLNYRKITKQIF